MHKKILRLFQKRYLAFIMLVVIAFAVFGEMYHVLILSNLKVMTISLDYPGVEEGLNPDGSRFVISEMTNDEILDAAKSGLKIESKSNDEIRQRLFITTKFSQKEMDAVVSDIRDGMQGTYVPTTFHIYYSQENKFAKNETYEFLNALAETYKDYFYKNHAENNSVLEFDKDDDYDKYDYYEIYTVLYNKAERMLEYMKTHHTENRGFRADDNTNFSTLSDELSNFKNVKLERFNAYIVQNNISRNRAEYVNKLSYLIDKNTIDFNKKNSASEITKGALNKYDPQIIAVAFVPSVDNTNSYYMSRTKTGIDDLAKKSYNDGMEAARVSKKIDDYNNRFTRYSAAADSTEDVIFAANEYLTGILSDFKKLSDKIIKFDDEYLEYKTEQYFTYAVDSKSSILNIAVIIKFAALGFMLAVLMVLYMEFFHNTVTEKTKAAKKFFDVIRRIKNV